MRYPKKGTPEYEKWILTPEYKEHCESVSKRSSKRLGINHPLYGTHRTKEQIQKQSIRMSGKNHPMFGKHHSIESILKISMNQTGDKNHNKGKTMPMSQRIKISCGHREIPYDEFDGFQRCKPYCQKFSNEFKNRVRAFFEYKCVECGKTKEETGRELDVHHVNYDKMMCCNDIKPLFVALCRSHNSMANKNREYWEKHYTDIIVKKYKGECYIQRDCIVKGVG